MPKRPVKNVTTSVSWHTRSVPEELSADDEMDVVVVFDEEFIEATTSEAFVEVEDDRPNE